jgi:type 1 fimbriae regulatory protein FimB
MPINAQPSLEATSQAVGKKAPPLTCHKTVMKYPRRERSRAYLTGEEVQKLLDASRTPKFSRNPSRDYCLLLLMFRHGLRVSEACRLKTTDIDLKEKRIHINRLKQGEQTRQPLYNGELGALNAWLKVRKEMQPHSNFLFISERRQPLSRFTVCGLINKYAAAAGLAELAVHPHMLRHACGYSLANRGTDTRLIQDYLGHKNIQHTVRYTRLAPSRFTNLW